MPNSALNLDAYFASKLNRLNSGGEKLDAMLAASQTKQAELTAFRQQSEQADAQRAAEQAATAASWVGQLGLEPTGVPANVVNLGASLVSGAGRVAGHVASLPANLASAAPSIALSEADHAAYSREKSGNALPGDAEQLNRTLPSSAVTIRQRFEEAQNNRDTGRKINAFTNLEGIVEQSNRKSLTEDLSKGFDENWAKITEGSAGDKASGLAGLLFSTGSSILTNPSAVLEYITENAPQLFVGLAGKAGQAAMLASNLGYAADAFREGMDNYAKANGGALPPEDLRMTMAIQAASLALAEHAGDKAALGFTKLGTLGKADKAAADKLIRTDFKASLKNVAKAATQGLATEAPTEGYQTWAEGEIKGEKATAKDIYTGAVIGGVAGAGLAGGGRAVAESTGATTEKVEVRKQTVDKAKAQLAAIDSGDVSSLAPDMAIAALYGNSQKDTTTEEQRKANVAKAATIVADLTKQRDDAQANSNLTTVEGVKKEMAPYEKMLAKLDPADPKAVAIQGVVDGYQAEIARLTKTPNSPADIKEAQNKVTDLESTLASATQNKQALDLLAKRQTAQVDDLADLDKPIDTTLSKDAQAAVVAAKATTAERVITRAMTSPKSLTAQQATQLANNAGNSLTAQQRTFLRTFSAARIAENDLRNDSDVSNEIYDGSKDNVGINQRRVAMAKAVATNNKVVADLHLKELTAFAKDHEAKAVAGALAMAAFDKDGMAVQIISDSKGGWSVNTGKFMDKAEAKANGALTLHRGTPRKLFTALRTEANTLNAAAAELKAVHDLKFSPITTATAPTQGAANVTHVPQQGSGAKGQPQAAPVQAAKTAGVAAPTKVNAPVAAGPVRVDGSPAVEGAGVKVKTEPKVKKEKAPADPVTIAEKAIRKAKRQSTSLWSALKHSLSESDLGDIYGKEWKKRYTMMRGKPGSEMSLADVVADGSLDDYLPHKLRMGSDSESDTGKETDAVEYIKDLLRAGTYLTYDTRMLIEQIGLTIQELEQNNPEDIQDEIDIAEAEEAESAGQDTIPAEAARVAAEESSGSVEAPAGAQGAGSNQAAIESTEGTSGSSVIAEVTESTEPESTEKTGVETQSTAESTTEVQKPDLQTSEAGKLAVLTAKSPEGTLFNDMHLLADFFSQKMGRTLVGVNDLVTALADKTVTAAEIIGQELTAEQQKAIDFFVKVAKSWQSSIREMQPEMEQLHYRYRDMMQFFLTETDGVVDIAENVKTAITFAAIQWATDEATAPRYLKSSAINAILGRKKDEHVSWAAEEVLSTAGVYQHNLVDTLGGSILEVLGFKEDPNITPLNVVAKLRAALGAQALAVLEGTKLIDRTTVSGQTIQNLREEDLEDWQIDKLPPTNTNLAHTFFAIARQDKGENRGKVTANVEKIYLANGKTQGILAKLFKAEPSQSMPSLAPVTEVQKTAAGTNQALPEEAIEALTAMQAREHFVREDALTFLDQFEEEDQLSMMGVVEEDDATVHIVHRKGVKAKNDGLRREWTNFKEYVGTYLADSPNGLKSAMHFAYSFWKNQRVGIDNTMVNPQTSKIVRPLVYSQRWVSEIALDNNDLSLDGFYLGVAEGLGVKTERALNDKGVADIIKTLAKPEYVAAVAAIRKGMIHKEALTDAEKDSVMAAVAKGGANLHSMDALMAVAYHDEAVATDAKTFSIKMMREVDGVANGTMLNHVLLGAGKNVDELGATIAHGGFFQEGDGYTHYSQYRGTPGNMDIYESTGREVHTAIGKAISETEGGKDSNEANQVNSIWVIGGSIFDPVTGIVSKAGRNLVKDGMNPLGFGSALKSVIRGMSFTFVDTVYTGFTKLATTPNVLQSEVNEYVDHINVLIGDNGPKIPLNKPIDWYMNMVMDPATQSAVIAAFSGTVGLITSQVLETRFAPFLTKRDALNRTAQAVAGLYDSVFRGIREDYVAELVSKGEIQGDLKADRTADLTQKQEDELTRRLRFVAPVLRTAMSKNDTKGNGTRSGLFMKKTKRKQNKDPAYKNISKFGTELGNGAKAMNLHGQTAVSEDLGVAMGSAATHSSDSRIMLMTMKLLAVLGIHDAAGDGVAGVQETATLLNKNTWETMLNYSPLEEVSLALENMTLGIAQLIEAGDMPPQVMSYMAQFLFEHGKKNKVKNGYTLETLLAEAKATAFQADSTKLGSMAKWSFLDQYAFQGGAYEVTEANRAEALAKIDKLSDTTPADVLAAVAVIKAEMKNPRPGVERKKLVAEVVVAAEAEANADTEEAIQSDVTGDDLDLPAYGDDAVSPFGELLKKGEKPEIESNALLAKQLFQHGDATARQAINWLMGYYGKGDGTNAFNLKLLLSVRKLIDPGLKIRQITSATEAEAVMSTPETDSRGWYNMKGTAEEINVLSAQFRHSGLTPELLLHELVHSSVVRTMALAKANPEKLKVAMAHVAELESLLTAARSYVDGLETLSSSDQELFEHALSNVDEMIAYGMTNQDFQDKVLKKVQIQSTVLGKMVDGLQKFVQSLAGLLGLGKSAADLQGMGVLLTNVSGIFAEAAKVNVMVAEQSNAKVQTQSMASTTASPASAVHAYNTMEIHDALGVAAEANPVSPEFDTHLRSVLGGIVAKLHGPFGAFAANMRKTEAGTALEVWLKARDTGNAPFASEIDASAMGGNAQEAFVSAQVEATVRAALNGNEAQTKLAYKALSDLYSEMYRTLNKDGRDFLHEGGDWATASALAKAHAKAQYDFVFKLEKRAGENTSDYLARFAALGLANERFNKLMQRATEQKSKSNAGMSFADRLQEIFQDILEFFTSKIVHTYAGQRADVKLTALVGQLVDIEAKRRAVIAKRAMESSLLGPVEGAVKAFSEGIRGKVSDIANSNFVANSGNLAMRTAGNVAKLATSEARVNQFLEDFRRLTDKHSKTRQGVVGSLVQEYRGQNPLLQALLRLSKLNEGTRKDKITGFAKTAMKAFAKNGKDLSKDQRNAITPVFMRSGAHILMDTMSMAEIEHIMGNRAALIAAIDKLETQLGTMTSGTPGLNADYMDKVNALGMYKATGYTYDKHLLKNAHAIARMAGTTVAPRINVTEADAARPVIEALVALYTLKYSDILDMKNARDALTAENKRKDGNGNGIEDLLRTHRLMEAESLERLFHGNRMLMVHGYTPEIYDPYVTVTTANDAKGRELVEAGYSRSGNLFVDPADPDQAPQRLYVLKGIGMTQRVSGAISTKNEKAKGSKIHTGYQNTNTYAGAENAAVNASVAADRLSSMDPKRDPNRKPVDLMAAKPANYMAPVLDENGRVVTWAYLMTEGTKNNVMGRDNRFDKVMGSLAGSIYDKMTTREQNREIVGALKEQYDLDFAKNANSYFQISANSKDPEHQAIWHLLPAHTKNDILHTWGFEGMYVRKDNMDIMFGYRKHSVNAIFEKDPATRAALEKFVVQIAELLFGKKAALRMAQGERAWQDLVSEAKDIIVIKTGVVMLGNIKSNMWLLAMSGVPLKDILHHHLVALRGAMAWNKDSAELEHLKALRDSGNTRSQGTEIARNIIRLEDALQRNPVRELMEAGMMPTIVEDINPDDDMYSYKSGLVRKMQKYTDKLNPVVVDVAKGIYMAHDTKLYQGLHRMTALSDFVARYTMYQHSTTRKDAPLSKADAIQEASDAFINYDIPMHRTIQYLDDMGILMFTKYFIRIQKVLAKTVRENPGRVLASIALGNYLSLGDTVMEESHWWGRIGNNPLQWGPAKFFTSLDSLGTVNATGGLLHMMTPGATAAPAIP